MSKQKRRTFTEDFKCEAVRLTQTSGRTIAQVADDLGIGLSTLTRWKRQYREAELLAGPHEDTAKELARLRKENELLRQERDLLKKATAFFAKETVRPAPPLVRGARPNDEVPAYRRDEGNDANRPDVYGFECQCQRVLCLEEPWTEQASA